MTNLSLSPDRVKLDQPVPALRADRSRAAPCRKREYDECDAADQRAGAFTRRAGSRCDALLLRVVAATEQRRASAAVAASDIVPDVAQRPADPPVFPVRRRAPVGRIDRPPTGGVLHGGHAAVRLPSRASASHSGIGTSRPMPPPVHWQRQVFPEWRISAPSAGTADSR